MTSFKGAHVVQDIIFAYARWYVAYLLSYQYGEELTEERSVSVDHFIINYWARSTAPQLEAAFHSRKRLVWISASFGDRAWSIYMLYSSLLTLLSALHATLLDLCRLLVDLPFRQQIVSRITIRNFYSPRSRG